MRGWIGGPQDCCKCDIFADLFRLQSSVISVLNICRLCDCHAVILGVASSCCIGERKVLQPVHCYWT